MHVPAAEQRQPASSGIARDINRRMLLNLIRTRQPISRADLARASGLQRSTVSLIVEELIRERWVLEGATGRLARGRRPTYLQLNEKRMIIVVDIRPKLTRLAFSDANARFFEQQTWPTPDDPREGVDRLSRRLRSLVRSNPDLTFEGVGVSVPGRLDAERRNLIFAPNLKWAPIDLRTPIERYTGLDVEIENAASACALAEAWFGEEKSAENLLLITVSEGIGCGIISGGRLVRGATGMGGEFGHSTFDPNGPPCSCGKQGCWEVFASNSAAVRNYCGQADGISFEELVALGAAGDARALKALDTQARALGLGVARLANGLAPGVIVFVGELASTWSLYAPRIEEELASSALGFQPPRLAVSGDGEMARLRGSVALVLLKHFGVPQLGTAS
jgi:predicted NBD/HSP70 family sugar kinase